MGEIGRRLGHTGRAASPGVTGVHPQGETALVSPTRELEIKPRGCDSRLVVTADQQAAPRRLASADQSSGSRKQLDGKAPIWRGRITGRLGIRNWIYKTLHQPNASKRFPRAGHYRKDPRWLIGTRLYRPNTDGWLCR